MNTYSALQLAFLNMWLFSVKASFGYSEADNNNRMPRQIRFSDKFAPGFGKRMSPDLDSLILQTIKHKAAETNLETADDRKQFDDSRELSSAPSKPSYEHVYRDGLDTVDKLVLSLLNRYNSRFSRQESEQKAPSAMESILKGGNGGRGVGDESSYNGHRWMREQDDDLYR